MNTIFFLLLFLLIISVCVLVWIIKQIQNTEITIKKEDGTKISGNKPPAKEKRKKESLMPVFVPIIALFLGVFGFYWLSVKCQHRHSAQPVNNTIPKMIPVKQYGTLTWQIPESVAGIDPKQWGDHKSVDVVITYNDENLMEFTTEKGTHFRWYKTLHNKYGEWYKGSDVGKWWLKRESEKVYRGEESNDKRIFIPLELVLK